MSASDKPSLSYRDAGVDIDAGNELVKRIKHVARRTKRTEVIGGLGGFGALFELPKGYREPVLVSGTDGVGTKLKLALSTGRHDHIGIDLVAMCVNDLLVQGAEPLFFLDYYATGKLNVDIAARVVEGIGLGCEQAQCSLIGGETAEMPGMYEGEDYDLAGFCVGIVEKENIIDGQLVKPGDKLLGLASSGPHSNGYSLIRKILEVSGADLQQDCGDQSLIDALMQPTRIYVRSVLPLVRALPVHALSHITGGGLLENLPRVMPAGTVARIDKANMPMPDVFQWLQAAGNVTDREMYRTFNCGIGMVVVIPEEAEAAAMRMLDDAGEIVMQLGSIEAAEADAEPRVEIV